MILNSTTHPDLLAGLASAGHGSTILIADGNYPLSTATNPSAHKIYLNLRPGLIDALDALTAIVGAVPVEAAHVMDSGGPEPDIFEDFRASLPHLTLSPLDRQAFYAAARGNDLAVAVATGEQRLFGNLLLTIGVVASEAGK